jgi:DNA polymerase-3 subunit gamma/tau
MSQPKAQYQVIARRYRPQTFAAILGQEAIVTTLKNAIRQQRLAHAYLFCGSRGTGKTTLARVFAKALNCQQPSSDFEPCNTCSSCKEITGGNSLDVLEIDGASHRGIDDIRQINETVSFAPSSGKFKIYIIDEVHMLTKEAFNALLKTLEEPPPKVKFFFATTEAHKVLPTILSRCQRFNLKRIAPDVIIQKLMKIASELERSLDPEAAKMIANRAEGAFRDAESMLDQIFAFHDGAITGETVSSVLGLMSQDALFALDQAGKDNNLNVAFEIVDNLFSSGKDLAHFIEILTDHFRTLLLVKLSGKDAPFLHLSSSERDRYLLSAGLYTREQCMTAIELLIEAQNQIRFSPSPRIALEALLLKILQLQQRISIDFLMRRLQELESRVLAVGPVTRAVEPVQPAVAAPIVIPEPAYKPEPAPIFANIPKSIPVPALEPISSTAVSEKAILGAVEAVAKSIPAENSSMTIDPTPTAADIGLRTKASVSEKEKEKEKISLKDQNSGGIKRQSRYDTLLQFAAIELEGTIQKKSNAGF